MMDRSKQPGETRDAWARRSFAFDARDDPGIAEINRRLAIWDELVLVLPEEYPVGGLYDEVVLRARASCGHEQAKIQWTAKSVWVRCPCGAAVRLPVTLPPGVQVTAHGDPVPMDYRLREAIEAAAIDRWTTG